MTLLIQSRAMLEPFSGSGCAFSLKIYENVPATQTHCSYLLFITIFTRCMLSSDVSIPSTRDIAEFAIPRSFEIFPRVGDGEAEASRGVLMASPMSKRKRVDKFRCGGYGVADTEEGWTV